YGGQAHDNTLSVVSGDLNGDGNPDAVTGNQYEIFTPVWDEVSVYLGDGTGALSQLGVYSGVGAPLLLVDLNGDGRPDLLTGGNGGTGGALGVCLGHGDGTFAPVVGYAIPNDPYSVAAGDVSGDGIVDLVVTSSYSDNRAWLLLGTGGGAFATPTQITIGFPVTAVALGDLDEDGRLDLVVGHYGAAAVAVLHGNGDGPFGAPTDNAGSWSRAAVAITDIDGDGHRDVVAATSLSGLVSVLYGTGGGALVDRSDLAAGPYARWLRLADVDGDGSLDVVVGSGSGTGA